MYPYVYVLCTYAMFSLDLDLVHGIKVNDSLIKLCIHTCIACVTVAVAVSYAYAYMHGYRCIRVRTAIDIDIDRVRIHGRDREALRSAKATLANCNCKPRPCNRLCCIHDHARLLAVVAAAAA